MAASQGAGRYILTANAGPRRELCEGRVQFDLAASVGCSALHLVACVVDVELDEIVEAGFEPGCRQAESQRRSARIEPHIAGGPAGDNMKGSVLLDEADVGHAGRGRVPRGRR